MKKSTNSPISAKITYLTGQEINKKKLTDIPRNDLMVYSVKYIRSLTKNNIKAITPVN